jgi:hypothetical protein
MKRGLTLGTLAIVCLASATAASAYEEAAVEIRKRWQNLYQQRAESLAVSFAEPDRGAVSLQPQPLLTYTNPVRAVRGHGSVFLWTESGRPVLIAAFWSVAEPGQPGTRRLSREWHSLVPSKLQVNASPQETWKSTEPGIEWQSIKDVDQPAKSRALRLTQMRRIIQRARAEIETGESELRLMPQPIYRYPEGAGVIDGAIFAFVMGTDPEVLALVEARTDGDGRPEWLWGFVQFTNAPVRATFDGKQIYRADRCSPADVAGRHHLGIAVERHPAELPE